MPEEQPARVTRNLPGASDKPPSHGLLWDEYKLLQEKLDRIGDFRFRVKAWVVSLAGILVVGGAALKGHWWAAFFAIPPVLLFALLEYYYGHVERALVARLRDLEPELQRREFHRLGANAGRRGRRTVGPRLTEGIDAALKGHGIIRWAHGIFYVVMVLFFIVLALMTKNYRVELQPTPVLATCLAKEETSRGMPSSAAGHVRSAAGTELPTQPTVRASASSQQGTTSSEDAP